MIVVLTPRESQVVQLHGRGCTYNQVAERLGVSLHTVTSHVKNAYRKLEVHSAAAAVMRAVETRRDLVRAVNFERGPTRYCPNLSPHAHFHDEQTGKTHDIDLPPALLEKVHAVLPSGYDAKSVEIIFRGKATKPAK